MTFEQLTDWMDKNVGKVILLYILGVFLSGFALIYGLKYIVDAVIIAST